jgi:hypothetical protein
MAKDDEAARKSRAEKLREQISKLKNQDDPGDEKEPSHPEDSQTKTRSGESPRDFIHERMRELDGEEK